MNINLKPLWEKKAINEANKSTEVRGLKALPFKYTLAKARLLYVQISHSRVTAVDR